MNLLKMKEKAFEIYGIVNVHASLREPASVEITVIPDYDVEAVEKFIEETVPLGVAWSIKEETPCYTCAYCGLCEKWPDYLVCGHDQHYAVTEEVLYVSCKGQYKARCKND